MESETFVLDPISKKLIISKDPAAELDYSFDWTDYLALLKDVIVGTPVITLRQVAGSSATLTHQSNTTTNVVAWIAGGNENETIGVNCKISTSGGRTDDRTIYIKIKSR